MTRPLILRRLRETAQAISATGVDQAHDLTGRIFQRLIADRKYLATFYTLPASAALLARLAVAKLDGVDWAGPASIGRLRVADFACGTGALLSAVYERLAARHERAGGKPSALHRVMMEEVLYGCDVMPSAIHITGATLSGVRPDVDFGNSRLYTFPYGRQDDGSVKIGSLELLHASQALTLVQHERPGAPHRQCRRGDGSTRSMSRYATSSFDLVIMNPPFTRATNHEGAHANVVNPAFAAYDASAADQTEMGNRIKDIGRRTCYDGRAGIASAFAALGHRKLKPGGVLALVLPLSAAAGLSWQSFRQMLAEDYDDLTVLSIAAAGNDYLSFSADTGLAECLVIGRKLKPGERPSRRIHFTSLNSRPQGFAHASAIAANIVSADDVRQIDDGPYGGTPLMVGDDVAGEIMVAEFSKDGQQWGAVRLSDYSLAQTAYALSQSRLWLPGSPVALKLKVVSLGSVGKRGLVHRLLIGPPHPAPFTKGPPSQTATYPALWNHNASRETHLVCVPDSSLRARKGMEARAAKNLGYRQPCSSESRF